MVSGSYVIGQPEALNVGIGLKNVSCFNGKDGKITLTVTGGTMPYSYVWSNDSTTKDIGSLPANDFSVSITDNNGCSFSDTVTVEEPAKLFIFLDKKDVLCYGELSGSINTTVSGGTEPYTFSWNTNATTKDLKNLKAADYDLLVTDDNNCTSGSTITIYQPDSINILADVKDVTCFGASNGSIHLTPWGGVPPYSYTWSNNASTPDLDNVPAYSYSFSLKDQNNCKVSGLIVVRQPDALKAGFAVNHVSCLNGSNGDINLTISGGTTPYSFIWSNNSISEDLSQLKAGTYSVSVTDSNNCFFKDSAVVMQPGPVVAGFIFNSSEAIASFTNTSTSGTYFWTFGDGFTSNENDPVHTYGHTGDYNVCLTVYNNCDTIAICDSVTIIISTKISISEKNNRFSVYPNPNNGYISIERTSANLSSGWKILDQTGRSVLVGTMMPGENKIYIDLSSFANGVYYLRMEQPSENPTLQKIIKL
jgi:hypothetical protein